MPSHYSKKKQEEEEALKLAQGVVQTEVDEDGEPIDPNLRLLGAGTARKMFQPTNFDNQVAANNKIYSADDPDKPVPMAGSKTGLLSSDPRVREDRERLETARYNAARDGSMKRERRDLMDRLTKAVDLTKEQGRDDKIAEIKDIALNELMVKPEAFERQLTKANKTSQRAYDAFFERNTKGGGLNRRRKLYSRMGGLRKARRLRKMGFVDAANQAASDWARSMDSEAPAVATQGFLEARGQAMDRVERTRQNNARLQQLLVDRMEQRLKEDPKFMPNVVI